MQGSILQVLLRGKMMKKILIIFILCFAFVLSTNFVNAEEIGPGPTVHIQFDKDSYSANDRIKISFLFESFDDFAGIQIDFLDNDYAINDITMNPFILTRGLFDSDDYTVYKNGKTEDLTTFLSVNTSASKLIDAPLYGFGMELKAMRNIADINEIFSVTDDFDDILYNDANLCIKISDSDAASVLYQTSIRHELPSIRFSTPETIEIELKEVYDLNQGLVYDEVNELVISGTYNSDVLGSYEISYYVENPFGVKSSTIVGTIEDVDTTKPTFVLPDSLTIEAGTAINYQILFIGYASDLSNSIVISTTANIDNKETGTTNIRVRATDSSGNYTEDTINLIIVDTTKPSFSISNQSINEDEYESIDWRTYVTGMTDNSNSDLTITVTDNVNYTEPGTYTNTARVTDESGNYLEKTFIVEVEEVVIEYKVRFLKEDGVTLIQEFTVVEGEKVTSITYELSGYEF